jgi:hypothetical protein
MKSYKTLGEIGQVSIKILSKILAIHLQESSSYPIVKDFATLSRIIACGPKIFSYLFRQISETNLNILDK